MLNGRSKKGQALDSFRQKPFDTMRITARRAAMHPALGRDDLEDLLFRRVAHAWSPSSKHAKPIVMPEE